jgi:hypothetical protein
MFLVSLVVDNSYPRFTWQRMLRTTWTLGFALIVLNIAALAVGGVI